ncbi:hypothetical protein G5I_11195 [Acromyrmex echinatior]|uniref:Uncharacterized protein n=1 Tax=Acromyrmex echinatior TaxID=103372 RepID=F4WYY1_ACREC|nr:hypothetical protein G5I_11195 [Acromyrmex echinatior]
MPGQILLPAHGPTGESYTSRTTVIVIVGADSRAIRYAHLNHWHTEGHKFSRKSGRRGGGDGGDARVLQMQPGVYGRSILFSARTSHAVPRHAAFSPSARLVIVCTDSGILCGTVSEAISNSPIPG